MIKKKCIWESVCHMNLQISKNLGCHDIKMPLKCIKMYSCIHLANIKWGSHLKRAEPIKVAKLKPEISCKPYEATTFLTGHCCWGSSKVITCSCLCWHECKAYFLPHSHVFQLQVSQVFYHKGQWNYLNMFWTYRAIG